EVRGLLEQSARATRADYDAARVEARRLRAAVRRALERADAIVLPTVPCVAPLRARYPLFVRRALSEWTRAFNVSDSAAFARPSCAGRFQSVRLALCRSVPAIHRIVCAAFRLALRRACSRSRDTLTVTESSISNERGSRPAARAPANTRAMFSR